MRDREWQDWSTFEKMEWLKKQFEALEGWLCSLDEKASRSRHSLTEDGRCVVDANEWDRLCYVRDFAQEVVRISFLNTPLPQPVFDAVLALAVQLKGGVK
jgi:hypothetical protein